MNNDNIIAQQGIDVINTEQQTQKPSEEIDSIDWVCLP